LFPNIDLIYIGVQSLNCGKKLKFFLCLNILFET